MDGKVIQDFSLVSSSVSGDQEHPTAYTHKFGKEPRASEQSGTH